MSRIEEDWQKSNLNTKVASFVWVLKWLLYYVGFLSGWLSDWLALFMGKWARSIILPNFRQKLVIITMLSVNVYIWCARISYDSEYLKVRYEAHSFMILWLKIWWWSHIPKECDMAITPWWGITWRSYSGMWHDEHILRNVTWRSHSEGVWHGDPTLECAWQVKEIEKDCTMRTVTHNAQVQTQADTLGTAIRNA